MPELNASSSLPCPHGWYVLAFSTEVPASGLITRRFGGRDIIIYRTATGQAVAADAICPHLGAHLGHGGRVQGDELRCPFHGFTFNPSGTCVSSPYGSLPAARLRLIHLRERCGLLFAFHGAKGNQPDWDLTDFDQSCDVWLPWTYKVLSHRGNVQDVIENIVDTGHNIPLHGFHSVDVTEPLRVEGPRLRVGYRIRARGFRGKPGSPMAFDVSVDGLGFARLDIAMPFFGLTLRQLILPTPVDDDTVELRLGLSLRRKRGGATGLWKVLGPALQWILTKQVTASARKDVVIWSNKAYLPEPALNDDEAMIGIFRQWVRQFYPSGTDGVTR